MWSITSTWMRVESRSRSKKSPYRNFKNNTLAQSNFTLPSSLQILPTKRCCFRLHNSKDRGWRRVRTCWKPEMAEHPGAATNALCSSHGVRHRDKWKSMRWVCVTIHDRSVAYILSISFAVWLNSTLINRDWDTWELLSQHRVLLLRVSCKMAPARCWTTALILMIAFVLSTCMAQHMTREEQEVGLW